LERRMTQKTEIKPLFTISWRVIWFWLTQLGSFFYPKDCLIQKEANKFPDIALD
jgi:hypothetical protein